MKHARGGFTAIELVSAITVLMMIAAMLGLIFAKGDRIWTRGTDAARHRNAGRTALEYLTEDLEHAVADGLFPFVIELSGDSSNATYGVQSSELRFVACASPGADGTNRAAASVVYRITPTNDNATDFALVRITRVVSNLLDRAADDNIYWQTNWVDHAPSTGSGVLAQHVTAFLLGAPDDDGVLAADYDSRDFTNRLPPYVDALLELLPEEAAAQVVQLPPDRQARFIEQHAMRYTARVHLRNRWGNSYRGR